MAPQPPEPIVGDRLARWRRLAGRAVAIDFVPIGIVVTAKNPQELEAATTEVLRRTDKVEN